MQTLFDSRQVVKSDRPFGHGIDRRPFVPDLDDLAWAAQCFGDAESDRELEERALQAAWDDQFDGPYLILDANDFPPSGPCSVCEAIDFIDPITGRCPECSDRCVVCGVRGETDETAMCDRCSLAAIEGSTTNQPRSFPGAL
jgi:hypothetical protein